MRRTLAASALGLLALLSSAQAKETIVSYPEGKSLQTYQEHRFDLIVPVKEVKPPYSLVMVIGGDGGYVNDYASLATEGFVVCAPKSKLGGSSWATSEAAELLDLIEYLGKALPIGKSRLHVVNCGQGRGFQSFVAFGKAPDVVSYTLVSCPHEGKSPPADATKRISVMSMGPPDERHGPVHDNAVLGIANKVQRLEIRHECSGSDPYYAYFLGVAEGRFTPGKDLSFSWIVDLPPPGKPEPGKPEPAPPKPTMHRMREAAGKVHSGSFVYFWSATDAAKPEAKALQNDVFFDPDVRTAGKAIPAVKLEREKHEEEFAAMGMKTTPAIAVLDAEEKVVDRFEGPVKATFLAKSLAKVAPPKTK